MKTTVGTSTTAQKHGGSAVKKVVLETELIALTAVISGFSFAAANSWSVFVGWIVRHLFHASSDGFKYGFTAVLTTLIASVVIMITTCLSHYVDVIKNKM